MEDILKMKAQALPNPESLTIDPEHYYRQVICGYYQFDCAVKENVTRSAKFYIPENTVFIFSRFLVQHQEPGRRTVFQGIRTGRTAGSFW